MRFILLSVLLFPNLVSAAAAVKPPDHFALCLPDGIKAGTVVSAERVKTGNGSVVKIVTVTDTLLKLRARCKKGKLLDSTGKEISFYRLEGCWGYPPPDYQEVMERQRKELLALKQKYNVITLTCNPSGQQIY